MTPLFTFHCRICYEDLNLTDRCPVVLPCGHTYICDACCQRLNKCMECRTPIRPSASSTSKKVDAASSGGGNDDTGNKVATTTTRNLVLMSLIEALQAAKQKKQGAAGSGGGEDDESHNTASAGGGSHNSAATAKATTSSSSSSQEMDERAVFEQFVETTVSTTYGTYVVRAPDGLPVYDKPPKGYCKTLKGKKKKKKHHIVSEKVVKKFQRALSRKSITENHYSNGNSNSNLMSCVGVLPEEQPVEVNDYYTMDTASAVIVPATAPLKGRLRYGQAVQVVSVVGQVARLARAKGYVIFEKPSHLVRVGEPLDEACRLQGMQLALWEQRHNMEKQMRQLERVDQNLRLELDQTMTKSSGYGKYASALGSMRSTPNSTSTTMITTPSSPRSVTTTEELLQRSKQSPDPSKTTRPRSSSHSPTSFVKTNPRNDGHHDDDHDHDQEHCGESFYICAMMFGCDLLACRDYLCTTTYTSAAATKTDSTPVVAGGGKEQLVDTRYYSMQEGQQHHTSKLPDQLASRGQDESNVMTTAYWTEDDGSVSTAICSVSDGISHASSSVAPMD